MIEFDQAIQAAIEAGGLWTPLSQRIYQDGVAKTTDFPYMVWKTVDNAKGRTFEEVSRNILLQFTIADKGDSVVNINSYYALLDADFDEAELTIVGWDFISCLEVSANKFKQSGVWYYAVSYEIKFDKGA